MEILLMNGVRTYLFSYQHDGASWVLEVNANSLEEAKARVAKMSYATYDGELVAKLPAVTSPIARLSVWLRNTLSRYRGEFT